MKTKQEAIAALMFLEKDFMSERQARAVAFLMRGEEKQFFFDKVCELADMIKAMPKTMEQDGKGDNAIVYLHYFTSSADWFIYEKDMETEQHQAFGLADLFGDGGELGYISIIELLNNGAELDFHWKPRTLGEARKYNKVCQE